MLAWYGGGGDWQLLFCSPDQDWDKIYTPEFQLQHPNARGWRGSSPDVDTGQEAFLLVLGQGNETLDYLGSLLWREREREREREKLIILVLLPGDVTGVSLPRTHTSVQSCLHSTSGLVKGEWFIGRRSTLLSRQASELYHLAENCQKLLSQSDWRSLKQPLNRSLYTLFLMSWSGRLRLQKCILHSSRVWR